MQYTASPMNHPKVSIGLSNPKSPTNVGAVLRAAGCFAVDAVYYTGERYDRAAPFNTDTQGAAQRILLSGVDCLLASAPPKASIVCVELVENAIPLPEFQHPEHAIYLFGPEDGSLKQPVIDQADSVVFIPSTSCLNLGASVNIVLYDRFAKAPPAAVDNAMIRGGRDANNRTRVKNR